MRENLYSGIVDLIAPGEISKNFEIVTINEKGESIIILFEEKANLIPQGLKGKDDVVDGFLNPVDLRTFPLKDKTIYLSIKRRRWKECGKTNKRYHNTYNLHRRGMWTLNDFGDFFKEELGLRPPEYNKL